MIKMLLRYPFCFPVAISTAFGLFFPIIAIVFLVQMVRLPFNWQALVDLHRQHYHLVFIWLAPLVLSGIGIVSGYLKRKLESLTIKTKQHDSFPQTNRETGKENILGKQREVKAQRKNGDIFPALLPVNRFYLLESRRGNHLPHRFVVGSSPFKSIKS